MQECDKHALTSMKDDMDRMRGAVNSTLDEVNRLRSELASVSNTHAVWHALCDSLTTEPICEPGIILRLVLKDSEGRRSTSHR